MRDDEYENEKINTDSSTMSSEAVAEDGDKDDMVVPMVIAESFVSKRKDISGSYDLIERQ